MAPPNQAPKKIPRGWVILYWKLQNKLFKKFKGFKKKGEVLKKAKPKPFNFMPPQ